MVFFKRLIFYFTLTFVQISCFSENKNQRNKKEDYNQRNKKEDYKVFLEDFYNLFFKGVANYSNHSNRSNFSKKASEKLGSTTIPISLKIDEKDLETECYNFLYFLQMKFFLNREEHDELIKELKTTKRKKQLRENKFLNGGNFNRKIISGPLSIPSYQEYKKGDYAYSDKNFEEVYKKEYDLYGEEEMKDRIRFFGEVIEAIKN